MLWTPLKTEKHREKTLPQVVFIDPDWFFHLHKKNWFEFNHSYEAEELYQRATSIRIPQADTGEKREMEYVFLYDKFDHMQLVPESLPHHRGSSSTLRKDIIDLSVLFLHSRYDKRAGKIIISNLKHIIFGNKSHKMTKERCEEFFNDESNFVLEDADENFLLVEDLF